MTEERLVNLRHDTVRPPLPLTHAEESGGARGWLIEAQRRQSSVQRMLAVRLTHPDGRLLTLVFGVWESLPNARTPVNRLLSPAIAALFRAHRSPVTEDAAVAAAERVFRVGWDAAERGWQGSPLREVVQAAAHGLDLATVHLWQHTLLGEEQRRNPERTHRAFPKEVRIVARLIGSGLTPGQVLDWYSYQDLDTVRPHLLRQAAQFQAAGWTRDQVKTVLAAASPHRSTAPAWDFPEPGWLAFTGEQGVLIVQAGLSLREALRLVAEGRFDRNTLAMLAGLRQPSHTSLLGLAAA